MEMFSQETLAILSLVFLVGAIAVGFIKKLNVGIIAIGLALVLGKIAGLPDGKFFSGFSVKMFITLAGVTFLFGMAQANGTLSLLGRKIIASAGKQTRLIPIAMYIFGFVVSAMGPGPIPAHALVAAFGVPLALQMKADPVFICAMGHLGAMGGCGSPLSPTAIIGENLWDKLNMPMTITGPQFTGTAAYFTIFAIFMYVVWGGWKLSGDNPIKLSDLPRFDKKQSFTLIGMFIVALIVLFLKYNIGLVAFLVAIILIILKAGDEKQCFKGMPWGTIMMVCGVGTLMKEVIELGGISLITNALISIMSGFTGVMIFGIASGILSLFSSTSGVVMPTMIPMIPNIASSIELNPVAMEISCVIVANCAGFSPASSCGSALLGQWSALEDLSTDQTNKIFMRLFRFSLGGMVFMSILNILGLWKLFC